MVMKNNIYDYNLNKFRPIPVTVFMFAFLGSVVFCAGHAGAVNIELRNSAAEFNAPAEREKSWFELGRPRLGLAALDKETVPVPWQPVTYSVAEQTATMWNRTYSFAGTTFLSAVNCSDVNLLALPMALNIKVGGVSGGMAFTKPIMDVEKTGKGRLVLRRTGSFSQVRAELTYTIEYDGLIWCELKLTAPEGKQHIEHLQLVITFDREVSRLTHYVGAPATYTTQDYPENSYSKELAAVPGNCHMSGLKTMLWIGSTINGLLWCIESDQFWWPKDRKDRLRLDRQEDGTLRFTVNMVTNVLPRNAPRTLTYSFGLMGTPVKPRPEGWRAWTHSTQWDSCIGDKRGTNLIYWPDEYRSMAMDHDPTRYINVAYEKKKIARDVLAGCFVIPYWSALNICKTSVEKNSANSIRTTPKINPEAEQMIQEWGVIPNNSFSTSQPLYYRLSAETGWTDYLVWCVEGFAEKMGHADGIYLDEVQPVPNTNTKSSGGYDDLDGKRRPTFGFFGIRNMIKRISYNIYQRNNHRPRIIAHCSATQTVNSLSGCDIFLIGEQYNINYFASNPDLKPPKNNSDEQKYYYSYALPMDRMQAECFGRQWGEVIVWLPQLKGQPSAITENPITTRDMLSRVMQGDVLVWPLWCDSNEVYKTWRFRREFDIGNSNVEFVPYWENTAIKVKPVERDGNLQKDSGVVVGYYKNKVRDTYLVLVSNINRHTSKVEINFGMLPVKSIRDAETKVGLVPNDAGSLVLNLKRNDYRVLRINY